MNAEPVPERPARLRMARATLPARVTLPDYLPARMLNEFVYCPRLFFYEWVDGLFAQSVTSTTTFTYTLVGSPPLKNGGPIEAR